MRIIGGEWRGRKIEEPRGRDVTRPTTDRVREACASMVMSAFDFDLDEVRVLDAFGGSGALGIEMLSRGARSLITFEIDRNAARLITKNIESLCRDRSRWRVVTGDVLASASRGRVSGGPFDLVLLDPPYAFVAEPVEELVFYALPRIFVAVDPVQAVIRVGDRHGPDCELLAAVHVRVVVCDDDGEILRHGHIVVFGCPLYAVEEVGQLALAGDRFYIIEVLLYVQYAESAEALVVLIHRNLGFQFLDLSVELVRRCNPKREIAGLVYLQLALRFRYDVVRAAGIVQEDAVAKHLDHSQPSLNVKLTVPPPVIVSCTVVSPSGRMKAGIVCVPCRSEYVIPPVTIWQASDAVIVGHTGMRPLFVIVFVADDTYDDSAFCLRHHIRLDDLLLSTISCITIRASS